MESEMTPEETEQKEQMVLSMCTCNSCPSWVECDEAGGYCFPAIGKSAHITEEKGCNCGGCPVYAQMDLRHGYYRTEGPEKEQAGM